MTTRATSVAVAGLTALVSVTNAEGANDTLVINALGGNDTITATTLPAGVTGPGPVRWRRDASGAAARST